jgi:hypothetical protein
MDLVIKTLLKDINDLNDLINQNKYIYLLTDIILDIDYNLNIWTIKLEIKNNKLIIHKKLTDKAGAFKRRSIYIIKLIENTLNHYKIQDLIFYIYVGDDFNYKYINLPIFILAKPINKRGVLFPDQTFIDIEPEISTEQNKNAAKTIEEITNNSIILDTNKKTKEIFFIGQTINLIETKFNLRELMQTFDKPFNIQLISKNTINKIIKMNEFSKFKYLLNLPGQFPWSFRFKFLFKMRSLVININLYNMKYKSDEKWINIMDPLFIPDLDYKSIDFYYNPLDSISQVNKKILDLQKQILQIYSYYENNLAEYEKIVNNGYNKSQLINLDNVYLIIYTILNKIIYLNKINNISIYIILKYINSKNYINHGVSGQIYNYKDNKVIKVIKVKINDTAPFKELNIYSLLSKMPNNDFIKLYEAYYYKKTVYFIIDKLDISLENMKTNNTTNNTIDWTKVYNNIKKQMEYLHENNIIHGDIQPKNIMYSYTKDKFYLIDFGLSFVFKNNKLEDKNIDYTMFKNIPTYYKITDYMKIKPYQEILKELTTREINLIKKNKDNIKKHTYIYYAIKNQIFANDLENQLFNLIN